MPHKSLPSSDEESRLGELSRVLGILVATLTVVARAASAQGQVPSPCRPPDRDSVHMLLWVVHIATGTDDQARDLLKVPALDRAEVTYVTDDSVCAQALAPYNANSIVLTVGGDTVPPSGRLWVVRAGPVYVASDPVKTVGEWAICVTLDRHYRYLARSLC